MRKWTMGFLSGVAAVGGVSSLLLTRQAAVQQTIFGALNSMAFSTSSTTRTDESGQVSLKSYYQLQVDENGETSVAKREFRNVREEGYSNTPQLIKKLDPHFAIATDVIFTSLSGENPWHHCPEPQIVVCLSGGWYVKTTDGETVQLLPGDVLFQDNTAKHPAANEGTHDAMHFSGSLFDGPCDQLIVQLDLKDGPIPNSKEAPPPL